MSRDESPVYLAAEDILQGMPAKSGHVDDITREAIAQNRNLGLSAEEFKSKLTSTLASAVKRKSGSVFAKVGITNKKTGKITYRKGVYRLKQLRAANQLNLIPPKDINKSYFGKAGEYAVISELLYWGVNVSPMIVDEGIDLVGEKNNNYFYIQVKTSTENDGQWKFTINKSSFINNHKNSTYYIFVLRTTPSNSRETPRNMFAVLPSTYLDTLIKSKSIKGETSLSISISTQDKGKTWRLNNTDCSIFMGDFNHFK